MRKFEDPNGGDVNYVAFVQAVDEEYTGQVMEQEERWVVRNSLPSQALNF